MAIINCKNCGGSIELSADKTFGTCEFCGSTMTFPKIDDDQRAAAFNRGNHFRRIGEFDKALAVYERIVAEDNTDAEAHWCCALCRFGIEYVEDPVSFEWIPTCHRASFDSFLEDVDYLAALEYSDGLTRRQYQKDAAKIAEVQRGILATSQNSEPYDVFICYKESDENGDRTRDSQLAQDIYYQLKEQGRKVFFARITLEDVVGTQYEPYIFAALNSAKVMVVVGTKPEYLNAVWVKNEWSRFLAMMKKDRSKLLLPCYRDMDPYDLPEQLSVLQSYDMGKIGFIQDLIRGIAKVLDADKKPEPVKETVVVQQAASNYAALLKRGNMALVDGDWAQADEFFEEVLNQDAECAEAYIGKFLAGKKQPTLKAQFGQTLKQTENAKTETKEAFPRDAKRESEILQARVVPNYLSMHDMKPLLDFDRSYISSLETRKTQARASGELFKRDKYLSKAMSFASGATRQELEDARQYLTGTMERRVEEETARDNAAIQRITEAYEKKLEEAAQQADEMREEAEVRREKDYQEQLAVLAEEYTVQAEEESNAARVNDLTGAKLFFEANKEYKDCAEQEKLGKQLLEDLSAEQKRLADEKAAREAEEAERQRIAAEEKAAAERKKFVRNSCIAAAAVAVVIAIFLLITKVILPPQNYKKAEELLSSGDTVGAAMAFGKLSGYKDSWERSRELWNEIVGNNTVAAGYDHIAAITADGTVVAHGDNDNNQCEVENWTDVISVSVGSNRTVGLKNDGTVISTNDTDNSKLFGWKDIVAVDAKYYKVVGLKADGTVVSTNNGGYSSWENIIAIASGGNHMVGLKADGTVVATGGNNDCGECNVSGWTDIVAISAGYDHTVGLKADGTVVATNYIEDGEEYRGQCDVHIWNDIVDVEAGSYFTIGLRSDGTVVATTYSGDEKYGDSIKKALRANGWNGIVDISALRGSVALRADGTVLVTGEDYRDPEWTNVLINVDPEILDAAQAGIYNEKLAVYQSAEALLAEKKFTEAAEVFLSQPDFEDSQERAKEAQILRLNALCQLYTEFGLDYTLFEVNKNGVNIFRMPFGGTMTTQQEADMAALEARFLELINENVGIADSGISLQEMESYIASGAAKESGSVLLTDYIDEQMKALGISEGFAGYLENYKSSAYQEGLTLAEKGDYVGAKNAFLAAGDHADAAQLAEKYRTLGATTGDIITFGNYDQDGNSENGKEAMDWIVLTRDGNKLFVVSRWLLDNQQFTTDIRKDGNLYKSTTSWNECTLRDWLNGTFYNAAFSGEEQGMIQTTTITETFMSDKNDDSYTSEDKVFLLSRSEVDQYMSDDFYSNRYGFPYSGGYSERWWLRDVHTLYSYYAYFVDSYGIKDEDIGVDNKNMAVRPAMWIDISGMTVD